VQLVVIRGLQPATFTLAAGESIVGRAPGTAVELSHPEVSRHHCKITRTGDEFVVENLSSTRGTTLNGAPLSAPSPFRIGDELGIGPISLRLEPAGAATPTNNSTIPPPLPLTSAPGPTVGQILVRGLPTERILIDGTMAVGRDSACEVVLNDKSISRKHATLQPLPNGGCLVRDEHSQGGSFVNGRRFDEHEFTVGDRLEIGPFCFQFDGLALVRVANTSGGSIRAAGIYMQVSERSLFGMLAGKGRFTNVILDDISVIIPPSRFFGLIGPSGAGKSSLLHTIAGLRKPEGGTVLIDGEDIYAHDVPPSFGFVPQDDIVHPELTVRQGLQYSARLRLARETPRHELDRLIAQTMEQLLLTQRADLPIWRLSGGQRKRVSVAAELLARPSILFLDEPSSGLDPATEFQLMTLLRDLADTGCTIVCTTHVMENAFLIDQLVILVGGCLAFQGSPAEVKDYFHVKKLTDLYDELSEKLPKHWQKDFVEHREAKPAEPPALPASVRAPNKVRRAMPLPILIARQWSILRSDWRNFLILLGQPPIIAALVCWVVGKDVTEPRDLIMFFAYLSTLWFGTSNAAQEIVKEFPIYRRERLVGVGAHSYLLSKFIFLSFITCVQSAILYLLMLAFEGSRDGSMLLQLGGLWSTAFAAVGIGCAISALSRSVMQAVMIVPLVLIPMIIFSGFVVKPSGMTKAARRASLCTPGYAAQIMMDMSFIYQRPWEEVSQNEHRTSITNLRQIVEDERMVDDRWVDQRPLRIALLNHGAWVIGTYLLAWVTLLRRERQ
jgi:ABC transport system ATP-binding/permease protein